MYRFSDTPIWLRLTGVIWLMMVVAFGSMIAWETRVNRDMAIEQAKDFAGTVNEIGGDGGGRVVAEGPPEVAMATPASHTGLHLREFLAQRKAG